MATMKTLNGYGFNATELNGKAASDYLLKTDTAADSAKLGGKAPEYYIQPRNLLDNSNFRNPVNQREKTSYTGFAYTIDRWIIWSTTGTAKLEKANGYLFVNPNGESGCSISQRIPKGLAEQSKTYTKVLCHLDGSIEVSTAEIVYGDNYDLVDFHITSAANIIWAALYEGSYTADTLPPYVPKGYAAELAECRLYYRPEQMYCLYCYSGGYLVGTSFEPMRIMPTAINAHAQTTSGTSVSGDINIVITKKDRILYVANSNFSAGSYYRAFTELSADL